MKKNKAERYHDRVARTYDAMYQGSRYWDFYRELTWSRLKRWIPRDAGARALDAGCGTGYWGLRLAKSGLTVTLSDLSAEMVEVARQNAVKQGLESRCSFLKADFQDLAGVEDATMDLAVAQGDPLSCCERPERAVAALGRVLRPGGAAVVSVDSLYGGGVYFLERDDVEGLARYLATGTTSWQTERQGEQFPLRAFSAARLRALFVAGGFEVLSIAGKPALPLRRFARLLEDEQAFRALMKLELEHGEEEELLGGAAHLELVARKPVGGAVA